MSENVCLTGEELPKGLDLRNRLIEVFGGKPVLLSDDDTPWAQGTCTAINPGTMGNELAIEIAVDHSSYLMTPTRLIGNILEGHPSNDRHNMRKLEVAWDTVDPAYPIQIHNGDFASLDCYDKGGRQLKIARVAHGDDNPSIEESENRLLSWEPKLIFSPEVEKVESLGAYLWLSRFKSILSIDEIGRPRRLEVTEKGAKPYIPPQSMKVTGRDWILCVKG